MKIPKLPLLKLHLLKKEEADIDDINIQVEIVPDVLK